MRVPRDIAQRAEGFVGRSWVLDEVLDWLDDDSRRFFLLVGEPGAGKTALAAWFAGAGPEPIDKAGSAALGRIRAALKAAHFCVVRGQGGTVNPNTFTQSIASQLSTWFAGYAENVVQRIAAEVSVTQNIRENLGEVVGVKLVAAGRNAADMYEQLVREPLKAIGANDGLDAVVLVDALDEALGWGENNIAELVADSGDFPPGVRFVLTSRPQRRVLDLFRPEDRRILNISSQDRAALANTDLRAYIEPRVAAGHIGPAASSAVEELVESAAGNFLYARFVLDEVAAGQRTTGQLQGLPAQMFGLYREFMHRLVARPRADGGLWESKYGPLLGCISVAEPAAPLSALPEWLGWTKTAVISVLSDLDQVTERIQEGDGGYRLYHFSMAEFLGSPEYQENGTTILNEYYVDPAEQHHRIATYYVAQARSAWGGDWSRCDAYGLRRLASHLRARADLSQANGSLLPDLYRVVLDPRFRAAQSEVLGDVFATVADLRAALDLALNHDDFLTALRLIAAHRELTAAEGVTNSIFDALDHQDFSRALRGGAHYGVAPKPRGRWSRVLEFYIAWEAALAGDETAARTAVKQSEELVPGPVDDLADALLVRTARTLAGSTGDPSTWLGAFGRGPNAGAMLADFDLAMPQGPGESNRTVSELEGYLDRLELRYEPGPEGLAEEGLPQADQEEVTSIAAALRRLLTKIAADHEALPTIDRALRAVAVNAYPRYRDIGLSAVGVAIVCIPDSVAARLRLRDILRAGLDDEGVTFTFDLAATLLAEAERRKLPRTQAAVALSDYLDKAIHTMDVWGTSARAWSATAAAHFRQHDPDGAFSDLAIATGIPSGFAGYAAMAALSMISRCFEFGDPTPAEAAQWGPDRNVSLTDTAMRRAEDVRDYEFRQERIALVQAFRGWAAGPAPDFNSLRAVLAATPDPDFRRAYKELASARWAADPSPKNRAALKSLIQLLLNDSTTLDTVLARLYAVELERLSDGTLAEAMEVCAQHFTQSRPWDLPGSVVMS